MLAGIPHLAIIDGDDLSVITLDGRTNILKDRYGLEFPYRPRNIFNLLPIPKFVKKMISNELNKLKLTVKTVLDGFLSQLVPDKILNWAKIQLVKLMKILYQLSKQGLGSIMSTISGSGNVDVNNQMDQQGGLVAVTATTGHLPADIDGDRDVVDFDIVDI